MSVKALTWAFAQPLAGNEKVLLLALADASKDDGICWPSIGEIAAKAYISERTVQRVLASLMAAGYVKTIARCHDNGRTTSNRYLLCLEDVENTGSCVAEGEGDKLTEYDTGVTGEGDTVVTPLKRTVIKNRNKDICRKAPKSASGAYSSSFNAFWELYPVDPGMSKQEAWKVWSKLPEIDQLAAVDAIPAFRKWVARQGADYRTGDCQESCARGHSGKKERLTWRSTRHFWTYC